MRERIINRIRISAATSEGLRGARTFDADRLGELVPMGVARKTRPPITERTKKQVRIFYLVMASFKVAMFLAIISFSLIVMGFL